MGVQRPIGHLSGETFFTGELPIHINRAVETFELMEHRHDFLEIAYVSEGNGAHHTAEQSIPVSQGDIIVIPVGVSHVFRPSTPSKQRKLIVYNCLLSSDALSKLRDLFPGDDGWTSVLGHSRCAPYRDREGECQALFERLHSEYNANRPGRDTALYAGVVQLLLSMFRSEAEPEARFSQPPAGIDVAVRHIRERFEDPISSEELAKLAGVGLRQFQRQFDRHTGMSVTEYIQNVRIGEAGRLLRSTGRKVSDIAASVGYRNLPFFNELFKKKTGISPREYRRR